MLHIQGQVLLCVSQNPANMFRLVKTKVINYLLPSLSHPLTSFSVLSTGMAFFSDSHIHSLTNILGHSRLRDLLDAMGEAMHQHAHGIDIDFSAPEPPVQIPHEEAAHYITGQRHTSFIRVGPHFDTDSQCISMTYTP